MPGGPKTRSSGKDVDMLSWGFQERSSMRPRGRLAFRPTWEISLGVESLEDRRLLSGIAGEGELESPRSLDHAKVHMASPPGLTRQASAVNDGAVDSRA